MSKITNDNDLPWQPIDPTEKILAFLPNFFHRRILEVFFVSWKLPD